jgi:hypothetical protein
MGDRKVQCEISGIILWNRAKLKIHTFYHNKLEFGVYMDRDCGQCHYFSSIDNFDVFRHHLRESHLDQFFWKHEDY